MQQCPMCGDKAAEARYYRLNRLSETIEHLCRPCWLALRKAERDEWEYFRGAAKLLFYYTVLPVVITAVLVWVLAVIIF